MKLEKFLNPKFIAVVGASNNVEKVGRKVFDNISLTKKTGVFPVNLKEKKIAGIKAYADISDLPIKKWAELLVVIVIPAKFVIAEIEKCARLGIKSVVIISAGFKEADNDGQALEEKIKILANKNKINILGPNCLGFINNDKFLNVTFSNYLLVPEIKRTNNIAFLSQSGAIGSALLDWIRDKNIGLSYFVSLGNKLNLNENDFFEFLAKDKKTDLIVAYLEEISQGQKFLKLVSKLAKTKPVAILKSGRTVSGGEMAKSHTGSLAGSYEVTLTALERAGAIILENINEIYNLMHLIKGPVKDTSGKLAIVSNAGGLAVLASDATYENNLSLAVLSKETIIKLKKTLPSFAHVKNPLDILGDADPERYQKSLSLILADPKVSSVLILLTPQSMTKVVPTAEVIGKIKEKYPDKLVGTCFIGGVEVAKSKNILNKYAISNFDSLEEAINILSKFFNYLNNRKTIKNFIEEKKDKNEEAVDYASDLEVWDYLKSFNFLKKIGLKMVSSKEINKKILNKIKYPIVIKFTGPDFIHKSDKQAVFLNIENKSEALNVLDIFQEQKMKKKIAFDNKVVFQPMVKNGWELILGFKRDPVFGPIVLLGQGGIYSEIYKDIVLETADLDRDRVLKMIKKLRCYPILVGARGKKGINIKKLIDIILNFSKKIKDQPNIFEVDVNPLIAKEDQIMALDVRVVGKK
ncbi:MAG: acetate--CoA ligase family protein [Patescibacteria group bacterium]|jgi:acetyltransferase